MVVATSGVKATAAKKAAAVANDSAVDVHKPAGFFDHWLVKLFFTKKFLTHRLVGMVFLVLFALSCVVYTYDFELYLRTPLPWLLPVTGVLQSVTAAYTFTFLPKVKDPGITYVSDKTPMSYPFIVENSFFELLLCFQYMYYLDYFFNFFQKTFVIEFTFVFFPYVLRLLWPQTKFRDALANDKNKSDKNRVFMIISTYIIKVFYLFAKHYIGFFLNYIRFFNRNDTVEFKKIIYGVLLTSSWATTISMFLHTLKFKHYIGARTATVMYEASYIVTFFYYYLLFRSNVFQDNMDLVWIAAIGIVVNFGSRLVQFSYQGLVAGLFYVALYADGPLKTNLSLIFQ